MEKKLAFQAFHLSPKLPGSCFGNGQLQLSDVCCRQGVFNEAWKPFPQVWEVIQI